MLPAAKHYDLVMGIDIHIVMVPTPGGPVPTPLPHPFIGFFFDPDDLKAEIAGKLGLGKLLDIKNTIDQVAGTIGGGMSGAVAGLLDDLKNDIKDVLKISPPSSDGIVKVNGLPRVHCGSKGTAAPPHFPMPPGVSFQAGKVANECEAFMGSMTVAADKQPFSFMGCLALSCHCPSKMNPTSTILPIPTGPPVLVGGPPVPSLSLLASKMFDKAFDKAIDAIKSSKAMAAVSQKIHNAAGKAMDKLGIPADSAVRDKVHNDICETTGHPVVIATGKVFTTQTDFRLSGPIPLRWKREWKSTSVYEGMFGYGWHCNYDIGLAYEEDAVVMRMADGRAVIFPPVKIGEELTNPLENLTLIREEKAYLVRDKSNLIYRFKIKSKRRKDDVLPLASIENASGKKIQFFYNEKNHLEKIIDSAKRTLDINTDGKGRILSIIAPHPSKVSEKFTLVSYQYDGKGNCIERKDANRNPFTYEYHNHLLIKETNRNGLSFQFEYDGDDSHARCIRTWGDGGIYDHKLHYDLEKQYTSVTDSLGNTSYYHWNDDGVNWKIVDPLGNESFKRYNDQKKVQAEINALGEITSYAYDEFGNKVAVNYPDGSTIELRYENNLLVGAKDQIGGSWSWEYNDARQLVKRTNPLGHFTQYEYKDGTLNKIIDPLGGETILKFNEQGSLSELVAADGATSKWKYDRMGRPIEAQDAKGNVQKRKFNYLGWVLRVNEPDGNIRNLEYDAEGNIIHATDKHHDVRFEYKDMNRLKARTEASTRVEFKYDTEGNLLGIINEHGYAYRFQLDANFRVLEESGFDGVTRRYQRNEIGRVTQVQRASGMLTKYGYDLRGRVTEVNHSDGAWEKFAYREDGDLLEATNNAITVKFERDALGRILKEVQGGFVVESQYNEIGLRTNVMSSLGANLSFGRNLMGDVQQVTSENKNGINWEANFQRDIFGLEMERLLPGDVRSQWKRDQLGRPIEQKTFTGGGNLSKSREYVWDVNNRLKQIIDDKKGVTEFEHDVFGNLSAATYGDGSKEFRTPDAVGNLFRKPNQKDRKYGPAGQLLEANGTRYEYDAEGNLIRKIEKDGATWRYEWNGTGMLKKVIRPDGADVSFVYDALGRRISKSYRGKRTRWVWDGNTMLHEWVETYTPIKSPKKKLTIKSSGKIKIRRRDEQIATAPTNAPPQIKEEIENIGLQPLLDDVTTWVFEPGRFAPLAKLNGKENFSIVTDHLGTPVGMYNDEGQKVWEMDLSIYGEVRNMEGWREACPFRYPGQYEDVETGLYYNRFRYYDAEGGFYISKDPIKLRGGLGLYSYVSDPNKMFDPFGLDEVFYRTVSEEDSKIVDEQKRIPATTETTITEDPTQAANYDGVTYKITVKDGTKAELAEIGVRDQSNLVKETYPDMDEGESGWNKKNARFKKEGDDINIQLGQGEALDTFNENIIEIEKCG